MSDISVGGQAVIEGVMMQSKDQRAIAVRKSDGKIVLKKNNIKSWINETKITKMPFLRGSFILLETMIEGVKSWNFSSEFFIEDGEEDDGEVVILKVDDSDADSDEESYVSVDDEETLTAVFEIFKEKFKEDFNFTDGE